jgi:sec-independent protein translocase protein TatC
MFLTPPDPMSQLMMAIPLCLLYEVAIWAVWLKEKSSRSE